MDHSLGVLPIYEGMKMKRRKNNPECNEHSFKYWSLDKLREVANTRPYYTSNCGTDYGQFGQEIEQALLDKEFKNCQQYVTTELQKIEWEMEREERLKMIPPPIPTRLDEILDQFYKGQSMTEKDRKFLFLKFPSLCNYDEYTLDAYVINKEIVVVPKPIFNEF